MDTIRAAIEQHGNIWSLPVNQQMIDLYTPLHAVQNQTFKDSVKVTKKISYGPDARNRLDIYQPVMEEKSASLPVVIFFHGGGFVGGDNDLNDALHANIGNFFASKGCVCVLGTYRLVPSAQYPEGAKDISQALLWVKQNIQSYQGDPSTILAVGQSSGGAHLAMSLLLGMLQEASIDLKGIILMSAPLSYDLSQERRKVTMLKYHRTESTDEVMDNTAVALLKRSSLDKIQSTPITLFVAELDPPEIRNANEAFQIEYKRRCGAELNVVAMKGHNHISNTYAIGLAGDATGDDIIRVLNG